MDRLISKTALFSIFVILMLYYKTLIIYIYEVQSTTTNIYIAKQIHIHFEFENMALGKT